MKPSDLSYKLLKLISHLLSFVPLGYVVFAIATQSRLLGADPQEKVLHLMGLWSLIFLLVTLSLTPINRIFKLPIIIRFRRAFGLYSAFYLLLHITTFFVFYLELEFAQLLHETIERPYITLGMLAAVLMVSLTFTSTKAIQRRMGGKWRKLHQSIYVIGCLGVAHFIWQSKSDLNEPFWYLIWLIFVLGYRIFYKLQTTKTLDDPNFDRA